MEHSHKSRRGPIQALSRLFASVWFGIALIALILVYSTLGSAVPNVRQYFELTEFQYFNHWVFVLLIALFCMNLAWATVRRVSMDVINMGTWIVHVGLLVLCLGSVVYFGRKIEGDVWLDAPYIQILSVDRIQSDASNALVGRIVAAEGESWQRDIPMMGGRHEIEVARVLHSGMQTAKTVTLNVRVGGTAWETIQLHRADPQRGIQPFARVSEHLMLVLVAGTVADRFYDDSTPALFVKHDDEGALFQMPSLPYYRERFVRGAGPIVTTDDGEVDSFEGPFSRLLGRWDMPIELEKSASTVAAGWPISLEIDGYLPFAVLGQTPVDGGAELRPIAKVTVEHNGHSHSDWLAGLAPSQSTLDMEGAWAEFRWLGDEAEMDPAWTRSISGSHVLEVFIKDKGLRRAYDVVPDQRIEIEGTDYVLTVESLQPSWPLQTLGFRGAVSPIALVWVESPKRSFQRSVVQRYPQLNQDRDRAGAKISEESDLIDSNIELRYTDASRDHFLLVAGTDMAPLVIHTAPGGQRSMHKIEKGKPFSPRDDVSLRLAEYFVRPDFVTAPKVIPKLRRQSQSSVGRQQSIVRVHVSSTDGQWEKRIWVPFSIYNTKNDNTAPTIVENVPGMGTLEFVYGRTPRRLEAPMTLEHLETTFYPGRQQPSGWTSYFRYKDPDTGEVMRDKCFLNNTATVGRWTFYQASAAGDNVSWTGLGVGNREGILTMLLGCTLISVGMMYSFCVKPLLLRRIRRRAATTGMPYAGQDDEAPNETVPQPVPEAEPDLPRQSIKTGMIAWVALVSALLSGTLASRALAEEQRAVPKPVETLSRIQSQIDLDALGSLAIQHRWRYSTLESWARDSIKIIHGARPLHDLTPVVAAVELLFNGTAYLDEPVIFIKNKALRKEITAHPIELGDQERRRIIRTGMVSYRFLRSPLVAERLDALNQDLTKSTAMGRLFRAINQFERLNMTLTLIPDPLGEADAPWYPVAMLDAQSAAHLPGVDADTSRGLFHQYENWKQAWLKRDSAGINEAVAELAKILPTLAPDGFYPDEEQRHAEVRYRRLKLIRYGWACYIVSFFISIFSVATRYRWVRGLGLLFLVAALGLHGYDLWMRWNVIGRVPVANMYEAVVSSAWCGALFGLFMEIVSKKRVYLLASAMLGFFALALPELLPDEIDNHLQSMMPILDDIMLRIHTVLIIGSYAVITLAFAVANCYLIVSAFRHRTTAAQAAVGGQFGAILCLIAARLEWFSGANAGTVVASFGISIVLGIMLAVVLCAMLPGGRRQPADSRSDAPGLAARGGVLDEFDRSHLVLLYTSMVTLFVGLVLGAVWADYSWGRPWGWDPKEVFALNTWLVYAVLLHVRYVTQRRALWTSILSVCGFATMQFNWWVVNFYIVGLHSYA